MLTDIYIEALLVDEESADQVWEAWDKREIDDQVTWLAWWLITLIVKQSENFLLRSVDTGLVAPNPTAEYCGLLLLE